MSGGLEEKIATADPGYRRGYDISYRAGLALQVLGAAILAILYFLESPFYTVGIMLFEIGVLLSAVFLRVRMRPVKIVILVSVLIGLAMQVAGDFAASEQYAGSVILAGVGLVCAGASGMAAKEAYCFGYREGWLLAVVAFPVMALANLFGREHHTFNSLGFAVIFLLLLSITGRKLRQPLAAKCGTDVRGVQKKA